MSVVCCFGWTSRHSGAAAFQLPNPDRACEQSSVASSVAGPSVSKHAEHERPPGLSFAHRQMLHHRARQDALHCISRRMPPHPWRLLRRRSCAAWTSGCWCWVGHPPATDSWSRDPAGTCRSSLSFTFLSAPTHRAAACLLQGQGRTWAAAALSCAWAAGPSCLTAACTWATTTSAGARCLSNATGRIVCHCVLQPAYLPTQMMSCRVQCTWPCARPHLLQPVHLRSAATSMNGGCVARLLASPQQVP